MHCLRTGNVDPVTVPPSSSCSAGHSTRARNSQRPHGCHAPTTSQLTVTITRQCIYDPVKPQQTHRTLWSLVAEAVPYVVAKRRDPYGSSKA
ncbi:hypothetical protein K435DRAFT_173595 [Dendrothele bispora CBS 962.96]|uniref:Uncharacterized protein n=1 Tax=Dendrothele bispora (strain CBS 962.96) TaxID=1314807 RepID=A0A4S8MX21_DENBC|nr:hypothetical protein K435DRAFT_173595 [Dendrothele bispora CBS 962.96]